MPSRLSGGPWILASGRFISRADKEGQRRVFLLLTSIMPAGRILIFLSLPRRLFFFCRAMDAYGAAARDRSPPQGLSINSHSRKLLRRHSSLSADCSARVLEPVAPDRPVFRLKEIHRRIRSQYDAHACLYSSRISNPSSNFLITREPGIFR